MPQDTLPLITKTGDTVYFLVDSAGQILPPNFQQNLVAEGQSDTQSMYYLFGFLLIAFAARPIYRRVDRFISVRRNVRVPMDTRLRYEQILEEGNPFYRKLMPLLKERFFNRTLLFMEDKTFHYVDLTPNERMPLLISAAAVQISFGLDNFLMNYFKDIYVMRTNYHFGLSRIPYEGHVNSLGIYLSWSNFEKAFQDYTDGSNVGLHEMAHALTYVNFTARDGQDNYFRKRFRTFSKTGRRIFNEMQRGSRNILGSYAASNYHEFWAVSVEYFFERPEELKLALPDLYEELGLLLNIDPLSDNVLINKENKRTVSINK